MTDDENVPDGLRDESKIAALLRAADEGAVRALRNVLDTEGRLAQVLARGDLDRKAVATVFGADARSVLASWSVELTPAGVRATGRERHVVRAVDDPEFFEAVMGRPRTGLEPWPDIRLDFDEDGLGLAAVLSLPSHPLRGVGIAVVARTGTGRTAGAKFDPVHNISGPGNEVDSTWPVDLTTRLRLPAPDSAWAQETVVSLTAVGGR